MQTNVTFKGIEPSDHLKTHLQEKLDRLDRFLDNPAEANAVLSVEKHRHIAEVSLTGDRMNIIGKEETTDMYSAIDMVADKLGKQIKKGKQKTRNHRTAARSKQINQHRTEPPVEEDLPATDIIVRSIEYKPMDVEEAAMQMALVDDNFMVFRNSRTDHVNVIYRRSDGNYGLVQPND